MINYIIKKFVGSKNDREVKKLRGLVAKINEHEAHLQNVSDDALRQKTGRPSISPSWSIVSGTARGYLGHDRLDPVRGTRATPGHRSPARSPIGAARRIP